MKAVSSKWSSLKLKTVSRLSRFFCFIFGFSLKVQEYNWEVDMNTLNVTIGYSAGSVCDEKPNKMLVVEQRLSKESESMFKIINVMTGLNP